MSEENPAARPRKRTFTAEYKLAMIDTYESLTEPGAKAALLRREGLYSSHVVEWRKGPGRRRPPSPGRPGRQLERLRRENERLRAELARTKTALEIVGKAQALLGQLSESADTEPRSKR